MIEIKKFYPQIRFINLIFKKCGSNETIIILIPELLQNQQLIDPNIKIVDGVQNF